MPPSNIVDIYRQQGWNDMAAINADIAAGGWKSKVGSSGGGVPSFNFDYEAEVKKAYGELGEYYDRLLRESEGDENRALARLVEDWDRGLRTRTRNTEQAQFQQDRQQQMANQRTVGNLINRGLYSQSAYVPVGEPNAYGVGSTIIENVNAPYNERTRVRKQSLADYTELYGSTGILRKRAQEDTATKLERNRFKLEQSRREQAGSIANQRASRAYNKYIAENQTF